MREMRSVSAVPGARSRLDGRLAKFKSYTTTTATP